MNKPVLAKTRRISLNVAAVLICLVLAVPFIWTVLESFHGADVFAPAFSAFRPTVSNYTFVLRHTQLPRQFLNSLIACGTAMIVSIPVTTMAAYGYSRIRFRGKRLLFFGVLVTQILPVSLDEAAILDGCGRWQVFWYVLRPLVTPATAATAVFVFVNAWQDYLLASSLITNTADFTANWGAILATSVLVSLPSILMFTATQRYFVRVVSGGVKG